MPMVATAVPKRPALAMPVERPRKYEPRMASEMTMVGSAVHSSATAIPVMMVVAAPVCAAAEDHRPDVLRRRRFEQVGAAARAVADVVTHQVGNDGRVAWIVLRDAGLDLPDQIRAHVGRLGVDPAAELREERHEARAEAVADDQQRNLLVGDAEGAHRREETPHAEEAHGDDEEAGDGAAAERDLERAVEARAHRGSGPQVGPD